MGFLFCSLFLLSCTFPTTYIFFCLFYWFAAIFASFSFSNGMNLVSINAPEKVQGTVMGLAQSCNSLAFVIAPLLGAYLGNSHTRFFFPVGAVALFIAFIILILNKRRSLHGNRS